MRTRVPPTQRSHRRTVTMAGCIVALVCASLAGLLAEPIDSEPITPVPRVAGLDPAKIELGRKMFHDVRLSRDDKVSCAGCHDLGRGGADGRAHSMGVDGRPLGFQCVDGIQRGAQRPAQLAWKLPDLGGAERGGPARSTPDEFHVAGTAREAARRCGLSARHSRRSTAGEPERERVLDALATFQRSLVTPDARFDRYLRGERDAITAEEARGYQLFKAYGCIACHQGANIGGNLFQKFGVFHDPFAERACKPARPILAATPSPARRATARSSACPVCATSRSRRRTSTTAALPRSRGGCNHGAQPAGAGAAARGRRPDRQIPRHADRRLSKDDRSTTGSDREPR